MSNNDDIIKKLRQELDRALGNNRTKRTQVKQLQDDLKTIKEECKRQKEAADKAQFQIKDLQVCAGLSYSFII